MKRIVIAGGGTGGHIYPSIAIVEELRKEYGSDLEIIYIGSGKPLEDALIKKVDRSYVIQAGKMRRYFSLRNIGDMFRLPVGCVQALWYLLRELPDAVFSKGGYVSVPVVIAAWIYRIPVLIHESDAVPGKANQILGKFASVVALGFSQASKYFFSKKVHIVGNVVRDGVREGNRQEALEYFGLSDSRPTILVLGGSQGSRVINAKVVDILEEVLEFAQVVHQTGENNLEETKRLAAQREGVKAGRRGYHVYSFLNEHEMQLAYAAADLVISRAGATSIAEIAANKKVALLVPLESAANDHQRINAYAIAQKGAAIVLEEANLSVNLLLQKTKKLLFEEQLRSDMQSRIGEFYEADASKKIANLIREMVK